jgi:hypothetical protein
MQESSESAHAANGADTASLGASRPSSPEGKTSLWAAAKADAQLRKEERRESDDEAAASRRLSATSTVSTAENDVRIYMATLQAQLLPSELQVSMTHAPCLH